MAASQGQGSDPAAQSAAHASAHEAEMALMAKPANDRIFEEYNDPKAAVGREFAWASVSQWRCMPRLQDFAAATLQWYSWEEKKKRTALLVACARSAPGEEPLVPYLTDPRQARIGSYEPVGR